jgi:hypothetical protein
VALNSRNDEPATSHAGAWSSWIWSTCPVVELDLFSTVGVPITLRLPLASVAMYILLMSNNRLPKGVFATATVLPPA